MKMAAPTFLMALQFVNLKLEISLDLKRKQFGTLDSLLLCIYYLRVT